MTGELHAFEAYLIFDFAADRAAAQRALETVERWRKSFKLRDQILAREKRAEEGVRVVVRLAFKEYERLAFERWLERIPREEAFAGGGHELILASDERFRRAADWFGSDEPAFH